MKKSFVAIAALVGAGFASAQSTITMFGVVDVGVSNYSSKSQDNNPVSYTHLTLPTNREV